MSFIGDLFGALFNKPEAPPAPEIPPAPAPVGTPKTAVTPRSGTTILGGAGVHTGPQGARRRTVGAPTTLGGL